MILGLAACGAEKQEAPSGEGFSPSLDTSTECKITVAGGYDNFEALETEFDHFNEYYPDVELVYTKVDDYNNMIGTVLNGNDAPDIYVNYSWMYGRDQYKSSIDHAENLADPALGLNLDCIRSNIVLKTEDGTLPMVPVFSNTYGMLVNKDLFEKEGLSVPTTYKELVEVCDAFREKGYKNPLMGFSKEETTSLITVTIYPFFCGEVADDAEAVKKLNALDPSAGEYMRSSLEKTEQFLKDCQIDLDACAEIEDNYEAVILRFFEGDVLEYEHSATEALKVLPHINGTGITTNFGHIMSGGYAAGYYSYKWAEMLDADAFARFKEEGIMNMKVAQSFREEILSKGDSEHPMTLYIRFRGRKPLIEPLLERDGIKTICPHL